MVVMNRVSKFQEIGAMSVHMNGTASSNAIPNSTAIDTGMFQVEAIVAKHKTIVSFFGWHNLKFSDKPRKRSLLLVGIQYPGMF